MPQDKLHSIAAIAKILDQPESTLHYWKNRFAEFLDGVGQGRGRRFTGRCVDVFRDIAAFMDAGMSVAAARQELRARYAKDGAALMARSTAKSGRTAPVRVVEPAPGAAPFGPDREASGEELAMRIGAAMAEAIGARLQALLGSMGAGTRAALPDETIEALKDALAANAREMDGLRRANEELSGKLGVLEAELVRLRKDRRELEKHLLEKIRNLRQG